MHFPHGLWRLPTDLRPPVESALARAEAVFRETLGKAAPRYWGELRAPIQTAMTSSFEAFHSQACLCVQRGGLTVSDARSGAEEFLETHARSIHGWLVPTMKHSPPQCPYSFRRYNSEDEFVFSRDMVEMMQLSDVWTQFLRELARAASDNSQPTADSNEVTDPTLAHSAVGEATSGKAAMTGNEAAVQKFMEQVREKTGREISYKNIYTVSGYDDPSQFRRFRQHKRMTPGSAHKFKQILALPPDQFIRRLDRMDPSRTK